MVRASLIASDKAFHDAAIAAINPCTDDLQTILKNNDEMEAVARRFLSTACPMYLVALEDSSSPQYEKFSIKDRLVKIGRNVTATMRYYGDVPDDESINEHLSCLVRECRTMANVLAGESDLVPRVRYGKTELQMPILTIGCMRFQQSWNRGEAEQSVTSFEQVTEECQDNLVRILKYGISMGINHIETAKAYGCSELQLGHALKQIWEEGVCEREDLIIQSKAGISSQMTPDELYASVVDSLAKLNVDYLDLFSLHGMNTEDHYTWCFHHPSGNNLIEAVHRLQSEGKIRHVGFSTHSEAHVTQKFIETDEFSYVNLHYHWCGSYTCSGDGASGGNLENVRLANAKDMGVFIISPYDKGGRVFAPSNRLRSLTLPDLEPIMYSSLWNWQHERFDAKKAKCHTIVCGAARPSDFDQPIVAALLLADPTTQEAVDKVRHRLQNALEEELKEFAATWHHGLNNSTKNKFGTQLGVFVWLHNVIKAYGLLDFARERYCTHETYLEKYDTGMTKEENIAVMGPVYNWVPGMAYHPEYDYEEDLAECPPENRKRVEEALDFVHEYCSKEKKVEDLGISMEWVTAYDMRPWNAYPERD